MNEPHEKYYRVLELEPGATLEEIKDAFRTLSRVWHPDRHPPQSKPYALALKKQKELNDAYDALKRIASTTKTTNAEVTPNDTTDDNDDLWWCPSNTAARSQDQSKSSDSLELWFASNDHVPNVEVRTNQRGTQETSTSQPVTWYEEEIDRRQRGETLSDIPDNSMQESIATDSDEDKLSIEWDDWRNDILFAVYENFGVRLNNPQEGELRWNARRKQFVSIYPIGTTAAFSFDVSVEKRISNTTILASSGLPEFDQLIIESITALSGQNILSFPSGSKRSVVTQFGSLGIGRTSKFEQSHYGDIETQSASRKTRISNTKRTTDYIPTKRKSDGSERLPTVEENRPLR